MNVVFFGEARDLSGLKSVGITIEKARCTAADFFDAVNVVTGGKLVARVFVKGKGAWNLAKGYKLMVNKCILDDVDEARISFKNNDEIGILPPFSGG